MAISETNGHRPDSPLKARRKELGLRQADVAQAANCAISFVSMTEAGYVPPPARQEAIAAAVNASVGSFW